MSNLASGNTLEWYLGISGSITMTIGGGNRNSGNTLEWYLGISGSITMTIGGGNSNSGNTTFNAIRLAPGYTAA